MMKKNKSELVAMDEAVCARVHLMSSEDAERIYTEVANSSERIANLLSLAKSKQLFETDKQNVQTLIEREARKLERLHIMEGVAPQNFLEVQKHFRSMVRAASVVIDSLNGSGLAHRLDTLRTQGIEILNDLYEHIKDLEVGGGQAAGVPGGVDPNVAKQRDAFVKVFTDFAVIFRGTMAVADLFSNDSAQLGGYNDIASITHSLEREGQNDQPLAQALAHADHYSSGAVTKNFFSRKQAGLTGQFKNAIAKAIQTKSPGFGKTVQVPQLVDFLMTKSMTELTAAFGRFNQFVANDIDIDWLFSVTQNPRTLGSLFKGIWDAFSGGSTRALGGMR
jgi:hypothetical protein